jgi:hypothetical protein
MTRKRYLQEQITTGSFTLPVVIVFTLVWWFFHREAADDWIRPGVGYAWMALNAFLLALLNNRFSLIRLHTQFHVVLFFLLTSTLLPAAFSYGQAALTCYLLAGYALFKSYQRVEPVGEIFTSFLWIGIASLFFPPILYFVPLFYLGAQLFQAFTLRTLFAGIVGLLLPYWVLLTYIVTTGTWDWFVDWAYQLQPVLEISYEGWGVPSILSLSFVALLTILGAIHCLTNNYADRIRTRFHLNFLILAQFYTFAFLLLQPQHAEWLAPLTMAHVSIFGGHLFALTRTKASNVLFLVVALLWLIFLLISIWNS